MQLTGSANFDSMVKLSLVAEFSYHHFFVLLFDADKFRLPMADVQCGGLYCLRTPFTQISPNWDTEFCHRNKSKSVVLHSKAPWWLCSKFKVSRPPTQSLQKSCGVGETDTPSYRHSVGGNHIWAELQCKSLLFGLLLLAAEDDYYDDVDGSIYHLR